MFSQPSSTHWSLGVVVTATIGRNCWKRTAANKSLVQCYTAWEPGRAADSNMLAASTGHSPSTLCSAYPNGRLGTFPKQQGGQMGGMEGPEWKEGFYCCHVFMTSKKKPFYEVWQNEPVIEKWTLLPCNPLFFSPRFFPIQNQLWRRRRGTSFWNFQMKL